jgi:hypothetical protein
MHMARPSDWPGFGSSGIRLAANSLPREFATAKTTKNCHINPKNGMICSHTRPGDIVLLAGEHFERALWRVSRKKTMGSIRIAKMTKNRPMKLRPKNASTAPP